MNKCYYCDCNESDSFEHIIPNALGGKLKAKILCKTCNNKCGSEIDTGLVKSLLLFSNFLNPNRVGEHQPLEMKLFDDGREIDVLRSPNGDIKSKRPKIEVNDENSDTIDIKIEYIDKDCEKFANDKQQEILKNSAKKHSWNQEKIDSNNSIFKEAIKNAISEVPDPILLYRSSLGKKDFLAIIKIAIGFYCSKDRDRKYITEVLCVLKNKDDTKGIVNFYHPSSLPKNQIYHTLVTVGNKEEKLLYSIVSLYGVMSCFVLLNKDYSGESFVDTYCYDLHSSEEIDHNFNPVVKSSDLEKILSTNQEDCRVLMEEYKSSFCDFLNFFVDKPNLKYDLEGNIFEKIKLITLDDIFYSRNDFIEKIKECTQDKLIENKCLIKKSLLNERFSDVAFVEVLYDDYLRKKIPYFLIHMLVTLTLYDSEIDFDKTLLEVLNYFELNYLDASGWLEKKNVTFDRVSNYVKNAIQYFVDQKTFGFNVYFNEDKTRLCAKNTQTSVM